MATTTEDIDTAELRAIASAALQESPAGWWQKAGNQTTPPCIGAREVSGLLCFFSDEEEPRFWNWPVDGRFVETFDPPMVSALLDEIDRLRAVTAANV